MATGFTLTGVDPTDPTPGTKRELLVAQSPSGTASPERMVLLYGNKTSAGTETTNTLDPGRPVVDLADCYTRAGRRSEIAWLYRSFTAIPQAATIHMIAVPEDGSATAATRAYTFATTATGNTNLVIEWGGYQLFVPVATDDTAIVVAAAAAAAITDWEEGTVPFTAAVGSSPNDHVLTLTAANLGPRGDLVLGRVRMYFQKSVAMTVTAGSVTSGTGDDDFTTAYAQAATGTYFYQVNPKHTTSSPSATDNGVGEGAAYITTQLLPTNGKEQMMFFGLVGTGSQATTVATTVNNAWVQFFWAENNPWTPGMLAAHHCAVIRSAQIGHPGANLTGYTSGDSSIYLVPRPYDVADYPTATEIRTALNNGYCPVAFNRLGKAYLVRQVTSRSLQGSSNDYRAREGHIPSVLAYFWQEVFSRWSAIKQDFVAADPKRGQKPLAKVTYPSTVRKLLEDTIRDLAGPAIGGAPVLDPGSVDAMIASIEVLLITGGTSAKCNPIAVIHNNKQEFLIGESSPAY